MIWLEHFLLAQVNEVNLYLIGCTETKEAALVDAGGFDERIDEALRAGGFALRSILLTHDHFDHVGGLEQYKRAFPDAKVAAPEPLADRIGGEGVREGSAVRVGSLTGGVLEIGGHTPEAIAYHFPGETGDPASDGVERPDVVFVGDAIFAGSVGGTGSTANHQHEINNIRKKIFILPDSTLLLSGHGPATTVGVEKPHNPFF